MAESTRGFRVRIADETLTFRTVTIDDPVPTGRQLLEVAGFRPAEEHLIFELLESGMLEERRLDETTDLRLPGRERFIVFRSDRSFRFVLDGRRFEWGTEAITEGTLKRLADVDPGQNGVWLELKDEPDRLLGTGEAVALSGEGTERFRTGPVFFVCIEDGVHPWPRATITREEIAELGGWDVALGVIEVDEDQNERTLAPGEEVKLRPGLTFGQKLCFKRG